MFTVASHINDWFLVNLRCGTASSINRTENVTLKQFIFGVSSVCFENITDGNFICRNSRILNIPGVIPMDETKKLLALVVVFNTFSLIMVASSTYCNAGVTKTAVIYISLGCMTFTVVCATYGVQESWRHFDDHVIEALESIIEARKCLLDKMIPGHCYRTALAATILMYVALLSYIIEWKFPPELQLASAEKKREYRLMTKLRGSVV